LINHILTYITFSLLFQSSHDHPHLHSFPARRSSDLAQITEVYHVIEGNGTLVTGGTLDNPREIPVENPVVTVLNGPSTGGSGIRSEEHTSELQSRSDLVCRLLLEKKKKIKQR